MANKIINDNIQTTMNKGMTTSTIDNVYNTNENSVHVQKVELLEPLVKDNMLLDILASQENFKKLKTRMEYQVTVYGENNEIVGKGKRFNAIPEIVVNELKEIRQDSWREYLTNDLKLAGFKGLTNVKDNTRVTNMKLLLIFRKG